MCLHSVDDKPTVESGIGWKVFCKIEDSKFISVIMLPPYGKYEIGKEIKDSNDFQLAASSGRLYQTGFHIFLTLEAARQYRSRDTICKVAFSDVVATGTQHFLAARFVSAKTVVARTMTILEEVQ